MIIEFSVKNFRSIRDLQTISFLATGLKSPEEFQEVDQNNIAVLNDNRLLKTVGIYGANGSGKSNIIRALVYFLEAIKNEPSSEAQLSNLCDPFLYQDYYQDSESFFQLVVIVKNKKYRYGFTVKRNNNTVGEVESKEIVTNEWLFGTKDTNTGEYFTRTGMEVNKDRLPNKESIPALPYRHNLFLTHASAFDREGVCALLRRHLVAWTISNVNDSYDKFRRNAIISIDLENRKQSLLDLLASFNLRYKDVLLEKDPSAKGFQNVSHDKIFLMKEYRNSKNEIVDQKLNLAFHESAGTQKLFDIAGLLTRAFDMTWAGFIIIDEVDSNFHPALLIRLIKLLNDPAINRGNTQLLFTSQDTNLLSPAIMRRDQFYFSEKREDQSTRYYSLADLKGIRNDADFAKQYLAGYYGGLPLLEKYATTEHTEVNGAMEY